MYKVKLMITFIFLVSCMAPTEKGNVAINIDKSELGARPKVSQVTLSGDQLIVTGENFSRFKQASLDGNSLSVISKTSSLITFSAPSSMALALATALNFSIETAYGATVVSVTFNLVDGSVTSAKIGDEQIRPEHFSTTFGTNKVPLWDGSKWIGMDFSGLAYLGGWDATDAGAGPALSGGSYAGEYYIVTVAGTTNLGGGAGTDEWEVGDWVVWNDVLSQWEKVNNSVGVKTFNGRAGPVVPEANDYTWAQINKTTSSIGDIADVDLTGINTNYVLKFNGVSWVPAVDEAVTNDSVSSASIVDGSVAAADLDSGVNTTLTQVGTNQTNIGTNTSNIATNATGISNNTSSISTNATNIATNASDISNLSSTLSTNTASITSLNSDKVDKTTTVNGQALNADVVLDTDDVGEGILNQYFTTGRAQNAAVVDPTAGTETVQAPSVASMKSYVAAQTASFGDLKSDGTVAMIAPLDTSTFGTRHRDGDSNYVTIKANSAMSANYDFILPATAGSNGYVLSTDGSGNLSWITPSTGSVTSVGASAPLSSTGGATPTISISQANTTTNGFLSSTDWNTFNNKVSATRTVNGKALSADISQQRQMWQKE